MIGKVTTLSTLLPQSVDSQVELRLSTAYLINTDCITELLVEGTTDSEIHYKFDVYGNKTGEFIFTVNETNAAIQTLSDATLASPKIALSVFEGVQSFNEVTGETAVTWNFNAADIVWAENDSTGAYARIWIMKGGHTVVPYIVDHNIDQIIDLVDTGTTTTAA